MESPEQGRGFEQHLEQGAVARVNSELPRRWHVSRARELCRPSRPSGDSHSLQPGDVRKADNRHLEGDDIRRVGGGGVGVR